MIWEGEVGDDIFMFGYVEFEVPVGHPCGRGRDCLKRICRTRREKGKEWNPEETNIEGMGRRKGVPRRQLIRSNKKDKRRTRT